MDPVTIANLIAALLPTLLTTYKTIEQSLGSQVQPLADILAVADANWNDIQTAAQAEIAKNTPPAQ